MSLKLSVLTIAHLKKQTYYLPKRAALPHKRHRAVGGPCVGPSLHHHAKNEIVFEPPIVDDRADITHEYAVKQNSAPYRSEFDGC